MTSLADRRRAIRHLFSADRPIDARNAHYALHHPDNRTSLYTWRPDTARAVGYVCLSRTGLDLFRPLLTMQLPDNDYSASGHLLASALRPGMPLLMSVAAAQMPLVRALFSIQHEVEQRLLVLDRGRYQPVLNVLVTSSEGPNGLPRYTIRRDDAVVASANVNWQSGRYAEIGVSTQTAHRRQGWGRSVVAALAGHLVNTGHQPLYMVNADNEASIRLAESVGFIDIGHREYFLEATYQP